VSSTSEYASLDRAVDRGVRERYRTTESLGVLFSGGVDSSLLAWELRESPGVSLVTVGVGGSPDLASAATAAGRLGLRWHPVTVGPDEVFRVARQIGPETLGASRTSMPVLIALGCAMSGSPVRELVCGQGIDELFLGYAHFGPLDAASAARRSAEDLEKVREDDWPRTQRIAARLGCSVGAPFLESSFVDAALAVPIERRLPTPVPKAFFRAFAEHRGLPPELAARPKRAMQYGSGIERLLRVRRAPDDPPR
jgi:asparagine synthase (glutamine-hydrolysing)